VEQEEKGEHIKNVRKENHLVGGEIYRTRIKTYPGRNDDTVASSKKRLLVAYKGRNTGPQREGQNIEKKSETNEHCPSVENRLSEKEMFGPEREGRDWCNFQSCKKGERSVGSTSPGITNDKIWPERGMWSRQDDWREKTNKQRRRIRET